MDNTIIEPATTFQRNETDFLFTEVDDETVLMNINTSAYFGLNKVATDLWQLLEEKISFGTIITTLIKKYEVTQEQCEKDVKTVLHKMIKNQVIQID